MDGYTDQLDKETQQALSLLNKAGTYNDISAYFAKLQPYVNHILPQVESTLRYMKKTGRVPSNISATFYKAQVPESLIPTMLLLIRTFLAPPFVKKPNTTKRPPWYATTRRKTELRVALIILMVLIIVFVMMLIGVVIAYFHQNK